MTDKQIIETLRNIKEYCENRQFDCINCRFRRDGENCQIASLSLRLNGPPICWNMEQIERIINE